MRNQWNQIDRFIVPLLHKNSGSSDLFHTYATWKLASALFSSNALKIFLVLVRALCTMTIHQGRYSSRGRIYLFSPMVDFNVMSEVGDTPP